MVDAPASLEDVRASLERPLTLGEEGAIPAWIGQAWQVLQDSAPGLAGRLLADPPQDPAPPFPVERSTVRTILVAMVERKVRNPDGLRSWGIDDATSTIDSALSTGQIYATPAEIARVAIPTPQGGLFSIALSRR